MPGLIACKRRWDIGSDDLVFPGIIEIFLRLLWVVAIAVIFNVHSASLDCESGYLVRVYYIGILVLLSCHIITNIVTVYTSSQGTIMDIHARRNIPQLLYVKVFLFMVEIIWIILGTYWAFEDPKDCPSYIVITVKVAAIGGWVMVFVLLVGLFLVFDPVGSLSKVAATNSTTVDSHGSGPTKKLWETRCKLICCCALCDEQSTDAFNDVANLFSKFFEGLDLVPTDIAAGLILVQVEQKSQPKQYQVEPFLSFEQPQSQENSVNVRESDATIVEVQADSEQDAPLNSVTHSPSGYPRPKNWMTISNAAYYMKYAMGGYGWPLYVYMHPVTGCCRLWRDCSCCQCMRGGDNIVEDNCCQCHLSTIQMTTGVDLEDIVYASFQNRIYETPFYVVLDHHNASVIIAVRGTLSLRDALTDLTAENADIDVSGVGTCQVHKGIMNAARYILNTLQQKLVLQTAFQRGQGYRLVVTGHSLGAGAATLLALLLRPTYPDLMCFAFSPPGGLLSLQLSRYTEEFVCSVVVGKDLVPRLSLVNLEELKSKVLRVVRDSSRPKHKILSGGFWSFLCGCTMEEEREASNMRRHLLDSRQPAATYTATTNPDEAINDAIVSSGRSRRVHQPLYPPGHIICIRESVPASSCFDEAEYEAVWTRADIFDEVLVSPKMLTDHLPDVVAKAMDQLANRNFEPRNLLNICDTSLPIEGPTVEGPIVEGPTLEGPTVEGHVLHM